MKQIIIGTTAINRLELHNDVFPEWITWLDKLDRTKYSIMWYIHIDTIEKLEHPFSAIKENFERMINNKFKVLYIKGPHNNGNFLQACKTLSNCIYKCGELVSNKDDLQIIWLEDDWKLNTNVTININDLIDTLSTSLSVINLTFIRNNYIHALAPSITGYTLWSNIFYNAWKEQVEHIDPEHCVGKYVLKKYGSYDKILNYTIINKKVKNKFLNEPCINYENSKYSFWDNAYKIMETPRYVKKEDIKNNVENNMVFYRITPGFCIDGCEYGRNFMKKLNIEKRRKQTAECMDFYKPSEEEPVKTEEELAKEADDLMENDMSYYKNNN